jgi:glutathione S-transferase
VAVCDTLPIARVLAKEAPSFVGLEEDGSKQQVDMWVDFINNSILPASSKVIAQCAGTAKVQMDQRAFSIAQGELRTALASIEAHLKLRNFLVGHSLTLADAVLVNALQCVFSTALDKKSRDASCLNTARYVSLITQMPTFVSVYGQVAFCNKDSFKPAQPIVKEAKKEEEKKKE